MENRVDHPPAQVCTFQSADTEEDIKISGLYSFTATANIPISACEAANTFLQSSSQMDDEILDDTF